MLSSVLSSKTAIRMNIEIMRAFVNLRALVETQSALLRKLGELEDRAAPHDKQIQGIVDAIKSLAAPEHEPDRVIGFGRE